MSANCGSCGGSKTRKKEMKFVWSGPNNASQTFGTELEAKAKVMRSGGSYKAVPK